ncbi:translation initiation factor IF-2-like [Cebus imitator]|uniref:translation initiation factor IF-2-like n=1 Tax=Cebus imitator TaxID=2715852 RepID=UPI0018977032|nr:translation initiation factor IF-2-like [Cebus imitator]
MVCKTGRCSRVCRDLVNLAVPTSFPGAPLPVCGRFGQDTPAHECPGGSLISESGRERVQALQGRARLGGRGGAVGGCRVLSRPQGGTLVPRPERSGGPLGADPCWPGTCLPVTQPRVGNVVRRRRRPYAPPPPPRERAVQRLSGGGDVWRPGAAGRRGGGERRRGLGSRSRTPRSTKSGAAPISAGRAAGGGSMLGSGVVRAR